MLFCDKKIWLFPKDNEKTSQLCETIKDKYINNGYIIAEDCDLAIAIGGDGSFL